MSVTCCDISKDQFYLDERLESVRTACSDCVITRAVCWFDYMADICAVLQENKSVYMTLECACEFVAIWGLFESLWM